MKRCIFLFRALSEIVAVSAAFLIEGLMVTLFSGSSVASVYAYAFYLGALAINCAAIVATNETICRIFPNCLYWQGMMLFFAGLTVIVLSTLTVVLACTVVRDLAGLTFFDWTNFFGVSFGTALAAAIVFVGQVALACRNDYGRKGNDRLK